ncbi:MAG: FG-GAP-like repeat-containing protein [Planctomycetes bacterium]|nr:FG-GAP-like repeat-containing protein [Planctomycetota bacterium]
MQLLADRGRWADALAHAERLRPDAPPEVERLAAFAGLMAPSLPLPAADHVAVARGPDGPHLVFAQGATVWTRRLRPGDRPEALVRPGDGARQVEGGAAVRFLLPSDRDGDGHDELFLVTSQGQLGTARLTGGGPRWVEWNMQISAHPHAVASGDVDGDGEDDVVVAFWENGASSMLVTRGRQYQPLFSAERDRRYAVSKVAVADLDGDGRAEVLVGGSQFSQELEVLAWEPERAALVSRARLPVGVVRDLVPYPIEGRRAGVLVVVDAARDDADLGVSTALEPWRGRDGVYLVEATDEGRGPPAVVARWTYGPDEPSSPGSRTLADGVQAAVLPLLGRPHVARAASVEGRGWLLELAAKDDLRLTHNPAPAVAVTAGAAARRLLVADVDGDGRPEVLLGAAVHGVGAAPAAEPLAGAAAADPALDLLRGCRALVALGRLEPARALVARLRAEHPGSWAASAAALAVTDALVAEARRAGDDAARAFARLDGEVGERRAQEARAAWTRVAAECAGLAAAGELSPRDALAAWERAAHAHEQAGDAAAADLALAGALATGPEPEVEARLRARREGLQRLGALTPLELDPTQAEVRGALLVNAPLRVAVAGRALTLRCSPDADQWAVVPVDLGGGAPLVVEGQVRLHGHGWATAVEVGLFEPRVGDLGPDRLTGLRLWLWDVATRRPSCRAVVGGAPVGGLARLPRFEGAVAFRLELAPLERGGARARVRLADAGGRALLTEEVVVDALPGAVLLAGVRSPAHASSESVVEQALWAMESRVTLERLRVEAARPRVAPVGDALPAAHAALALDDPAAARRLYDHRLGREVSAEALLHRALARGRQGDAGAAQDLVEAARRAPYRALLWLEDMADLLPDAHPAYAQTIGAALRAMAGSTRPLPQALGRQLLGELDVVLDRLGDDPASSPDPGAEAEVQEAAIYLNMRGAHHPQRWRQFPAYQRLVPLGRYPRRGLPRIIPAPATDPEVERAEVEAARTRDASCLLEQHRALLRARLAGAAGPEAALALATFYVNAGAFGMAEQVSRDLLERPNLPAVAQASAWLLIARAAAAGGREADVADALARVRALGVYTAAQLDESEHTLRGLLNVVGPVLVDTHRAR